MRGYLKPCLVLYWLGLSAWMSALAAAGLSAANVFGQLPEMGLALERFEAYPVEEHGTIAAGLVMADVFFTVDVIQFMAIPITLITLALQLTIFELPALKPSNLVRTGCLGLAAGFFGYYATALAPPLNATLRTYWQAAQRGELDRAAALQQEFQAGHAVAEHILQANAVLVVIAVVASAVALVPSAPRAPGLPEPELLKRR